MGSHTQEITHIKFLSCVCARACVRVSSGSWIAHHKQIYRDRGDKCTAQFSTSADVAKMKLTSIIKQSLEHIIKGLDAELLEGHKGHTKQTHKNNSTAW